MQGVKGSRLSKWIASKDARRESVGAVEPQKLQNLVSACLCIRCQNLCYKLVPSNFGLDYLVGFAWGDLDDAFYRDLFFHMRSQAFKNLQSLQAINSV